MNEIKNPLALDLRALNDIKNFRDDANKHSGMIQNVSE